MKNTLIVLFIAITFICNAQSTFYLAPTGNDNNAGTLSSPFKTLNKAWTVLTPGSTLFIRGGNIAFNSQQSLSGKNGNANNLIKIWAYPGETPVLTQSLNYNSGEQDLIRFEGNYFHWKGIEIAYGSYKGSWSAFRTHTGSNNLFEQINYHHNGLGFSIKGSATNNTFLNCDFHHSLDVNQGDGDGVGTNEMNANTVNTFIRCRAYFNSDDGFDAWENNGTVVYDNCWAFFNGRDETGYKYPQGDGGGIKIGSVSRPGALIRTVKNCIVYGNTKWGIVDNNSNCSANIYNNTVVSNGGANFYWGYWSPNYPTGNLKNNISINPNTSQYSIFGAASTKNNSWQLSGNVSMSDFVNTDANQLSLPRKADGGLPTITFLNLSPSSKMIDAGVNVGIAFNGTAPDLGAFESGGTIPPPPPNQPPTSNAGADKTITLPANTVNLIGTGSDPDGIVVSYSWKLTAGVAVLSTTTNPSITISELTEGGYNLELTVTDDKGATDVDNVNITVNPALPPPPPPPSFDTTRCDFIIYILNTNSRLVFKRVNYFVKRVDGYYDSTGTKVDIYEYVKAEERVIIKQ